MSNNRTNNPSNSWAAGAPHNPEIFGVTPSTPVPTFRPPNTPRTVGEETALKSYTRKRIAFTSIPFNIRSLFTKVEARIYLKDVSLAHLAMSKQSELSLYLIEYHTHAFIHKQKQAPSCCNNRSILCFHILYLSRPNCFSSCKDTCSGNP